MFNLEENPNPTINLSIHVTNHAETPAAKAKLFVCTIENTPVYEAEFPINLNQGNSLDIPISFTLPDLEIKDYGIGFCLFQLEDAEGNIIQPKTETPTGRFSIYKLITPADINGDFQYTGTYTPETVHPSGNYRLKLELIAPNGVNELARYQDFNYCRSGFHVELGSVNQNGIAKQWLISGESYTIQFNCPAVALNISKPGIFYQEGNFKYH